MLRVAAVQMASKQDINVNVTAACAFVEQAAKQGAKLVVLPENFANLGLTQEQSLQMAEPFQQGPIQERLALCAKKNRVWLIGGTFPLQDPSHKKVSASCLVWNAQGECVGRYDKIHLFDVLVGEKEAYSESTLVQHGKQVVVLDTPIGRIGLAICYDLRFPELFRVFMHKGVDIIVLPSAFTIPTGKAHWEVLLRARAIENLCYVIAPNQVGIRANGIGTYGHSMIVGPWGEILDSLEKQAGVIIADLDFEKMHQMRNKFPALSHCQPFVLQELIQAQR